MTLGVSGGAAVARPDADSVLGEALSVAHVGPDERLDVGHHLLEVIAVVVDPLVQKIADAEVTDNRMLTAPREIGLPQALHEGDALVAEPRELVQQRRGVAVAVASGPRHRDLVPGLEPGLVVVEDLTDPPGEAASLGLDQVTQRLKEAPFTRPRVPAHDGFGKLSQLGADGHARRAEQGGHLARHQRIKGFSHQ